MRLGAAFSWIIVVVVVSLGYPRGTKQLQSQADAEPKFNLTVNESFKSVSVYVKSGDNVTARWCYRAKPDWCSNKPAKNKPVSIAPSLSRTAVLHVPYLLPCLCVEVYYPTFDSKRFTKCPLTNSTVSDVNDFWKSTTVKLLGNSLAMVSKCPAAEIKVSTALCWKHGQHCTVVFNLSLVEKIDGLKREYNLSAVDKHPQMCVQRSLKGSHNITCPFEADMSSWRVHIKLGRKSIFVYINSTVPAKFSVQLCKPRQTKCVSIEQTHSINIKETVVTFELPVLLIEERPCVQVWQSEPALHGRRILCPDYTHHRYGIYSAVSLVCVVIVVSLGVCFHRLTKGGTAGWLYIQRPVLLVCSSEDSAHVSTVCALASILQGDLGATVHLALWAQSTQSQYGTGVADLGPLPWLYGQWDTVLKAQGTVLIIWSPDAKIAYRKWWSENEENKSATLKDSHSQKPHKIDETVKLTGKCKNVKKAEKHTNQVTEPCTVIAPAFKAALTCLMGALQANGGQQVAFVFLQGQGNSKDIPKVFRGIPRYCLPRQFSGLIQELGVKARLSQNTKLDCWTRLLTKVLPFWMARRLSRRLQTLLPQK